MFKAGVRTPRGSAGGLKGDVFQSPGPDCAWTTSRTGAKRHSPRRREAAPSRKARMGRDVRGTRKTRLRVSESAEMRAWRTRRRSEHGRGRRKRWAFVVDSAQGALGQESLQLRSFSDQIRVRFRSAIRKHISLLLFALFWVVRVVNLGMSLLPSFPPTSIRFSITRCARASHD